MSGLTLLIQWEATRLLGQEASLLETQARWRTLQSTRVATHGIHRDSMRNCFKTEA